MTTAVSISIAFVSWKWEKLKKLKRKSFSLKVENPIQMMHNMLLYCSISKTESYSISGFGPVRKWRQ